PFVYVERQISWPRVDVGLDSRWFPEQERPAGHAGLLGIRLGLAKPEMLKRQVRALLRAAIHGPLRILFPFVSTVQEVRTARAIMDQARRELRERHIEAPPVAVGIMIEVPSA